MTNQNSSDTILLHIALSQTSTFAPLHVLKTPTLLSHILDLVSPPSIIVLPASLLRPVLEQLIDDDPRESSIQPILVVVGTENEIEGIVQLAGAAGERGLRVIGIRDLERVGDGIRDSHDESSERNDVAVKETDLETIIWSTGEGEVSSHFPHRSLSLPSFWLTLVHRWDA